MSKTISNSAAGQANRAASAIASVWQTTQHVDQAWHAIDPDTRMSIVQEWSRLIQEDPGHALPRIVAGMQDQPALWKAWNKLEPQERTTRESIFQAILKQNGF